MNQQKVFMMFLKKNYQLIMQENKIIKIKKKELLYKIEDYKQQLQHTKQEFL